MSDVKQESDAESDYPTPQEFCLGVPLYKLYPVDNSVLEFAEKLLWFDGALDMYCPYCTEVSVFRCQTNFQHANHFDMWRIQDYLCITATCSRDRRHIGFFFFRKDEAGIQKVGQYPSSADVAEFNAKKYVSVLSKEDFSGLKTAIRLSAHGVGAGALVYLRRIFESLITEAYSIASQSPDWNKAAFDKGRMQDRVKILSKYLPDFLVQHHRLYRILSKGIHEMSEQECLAYFPVLKMSIELILDEKVMMLETEKKIKEASSFINQFEGS